MKKPIFILFVIFAGIGASGTLYAVAADTISPKVEPVLQVESVSTKSGEIDPATVKVKTEDGEQTLEEKLRAQIESELTEREAALKAREDAVSGREEAAAATETRAKLQIEKLKDISANLEDAVGAISKKKREDVAKLASMYGNMKAKDAAAIINTLDTRLAVEIIDGMSPSASGSILGLMNAKKASEITGVIYSRGEKINE